ncbi:hypothetical protein [uncultured Alistipes sp.]|jgi:hypothetical protein|uniref:hypothetical protein n=1 Tax=uncultured Alistipes sp. TaxID=538949 RepID=UPI0025DE5A7A|nr:hypothetical protein [uncultured Alistipes sp.]
MKKTLLLVAVFLMASIATAYAARVRIPIGEHQKIKQVLELPDSAYYQTNDGNYINVGYMYTVYEVAYVPLWTTDKGRLVGFVPSQPNSFYDLNEEMFSWISEDTGVEDLDKLKKMPFWDSWGGKLIAIALIAALIAYFRSKSDDDDEAPAVTEKAEQPADAAEPEQKE